MTTKCNDCGNTYSRTYCDFCKRMKRWSPTKHKQELSPRIQKDLQNIEIEIPEKELKFVRNGGWLFLTGEVGCGKTLYAITFLLASLRSRFVYQQGPRVHKFITVPDLLDEIKKSFDSEEKLDPVEFYSNVDFLILDDLGVEKITDWSLQELYRIINSRYENLKPTIFTSNATLGELSEQLGNRIPSRIKQMGIIKKMKAIDYRLEE